jgi:hypothetical protein
MIQPALFLIYFWIYLLFGMGFVLWSKLLGGKCNEVVIGYGPRIAAFSLGKTHYQLKLLPVTVNMNTERALSEVRKFLIYVGGLLTPLLVAIALVYAILLNGVDAPLGTGAVIYATYPEDGAEGLHVGDVVRAVDDREVRDALDLAGALSEWRSGRRTFAIDRDGEGQTVEIEGPQLPVDAAGQPLDHRAEIAFYSQCTRTYYSPLYAIRQLPASLVHAFMLNMVFQHASNPDLHYFVHSRSWNFLLHTVTTLEFMSAFTLMFMPFIFIWMVIERRREDRRGVQIIAALVAQILLGSERPSPPSAPPPRKPSFLRNALFWLLIIGIGVLFFMAIDRLQPKATLNNPFVVGMVQDPALDIRWSSWIGP